MPSISHPSSESCRVLVVDDAPAVREALRWMLQELPGIELVGEAANGHEALVRAEQLVPQLVILDVRLPLLDGYSVAQRLRRMAIPPRIIFLSGQSDPQGYVRAREAGADAYVEKGQGWDALLQVIRQTLSDLDEANMLRE
jgi:DNA-binding NarL/FixJ family response regulator